MNDKVTFSAVLSTTFREGEDVTHVIALEQDEAGHNRAVWYRTSVEDGEPYTTMDLLIATYFGPEGRAIAVREYHRKIDAAPATWTAEV